MAKLSAMRKRSIVREFANLFGFRGSLLGEELDRINSKYKNPPSLPPTEEASRRTWRSVGVSMRWAINEYGNKLSEQETA